jgi:hypothetical protein
VCLGNGQHDAVGLPEQIGRHRDHLREGGEHLAGLDLLVVSARLGSVSSPGRLPIMSAIIWRGLFFRPSSESMPSGLSPSSTTRTACPSSP